MAIDPRNEGRMTIWRERDGQFGKYVGFNFQLNGVEYMGFAEKYTGTNPKAPGYSGKIKIKQAQGYTPPVPQATAPYVPPTAPIGAPAPTQPVVTPTAPVAPVVDTNGQAGTGMPF